MFLVNYVAKCQMSSVPYGPISKKILLSVAKKIQLRKTFCTLELFVMVLGEGGATFTSSVQTPLVRPDVSNPLRYTTPSGFWDNKQDVGTFMKL